MRPFYSVHLSRTTFSRMFLPYVVKIGSPRFRRGLLDVLPFQAWKDLAAAVDKMYRGSEEILNKKKQAIEKGDEAVKQLISNGNDIMSTLCEFRLFTIARLFNDGVSPVRANMQAVEADRLPDSEVLGQVK